MAKKKAKKKVAKKSAKKTKKKIAKQAVRKPAKNAAKSTAKKPAKKESATGGSTAPIGGIIWSEIHVDNPEQVQSFYADLFGWQTKDMPMGPGELYRMLSNKGVDLGGVVNKAPGSASTWVNYIHVNDVDSIAARAEQMGGRITVPPTDIPGMGRFAILQDPGGAAFALFKGATP